MIEFNQKAEPTAKHNATVTLPIDKRVKSRLRVTLDDGRDAGIILNRGDSLLHGDKLLASDGTVALVQAAPEALSKAEVTDRLLFARAAYHLGNRHVPVEISVKSDSPFIGTISYLRDHVLDEMLAGLGVVVTTIDEPFTPEAGAYGGGHHHHH